MDVRISFVIPAYNSTFMLARCLASIVTQDSAPHEIVVSDDSTDDAVRGLVSEWSTIYPQITYSAGPKTGNAADNWNHGLKHCTGDYICLIHHDESISRKDYVSQIKSAISKYERAVCFFSESVVVGGLRRSRYHTALKIASFIGYPRWSLYASNWIGPSAAFIFQRSALLTFDPSLKYLVDVDFYVRALEAAKLVKIPGMFIFSGSHSEQITARINGPVLALQEIDRIISGCSRDDRSKLKLARSILQVRSILSLIRPITPRK